MSKPAVSVLIRVRDEVERLRSTLRALSGQILDQPIEVVVLDNESADGSAQLALEHGARVFTFPRALFGYGRALNLGVEMCRGDIVVLLSSHSAPRSPSWLSDLVQPFADDAAVGAVFCPSNSAVSHGSIRAEALCGIPCARYEDRSKAVHGTVHGGQRPIRRCIVLELCVCCTARCRLAASVP